VPGERGKTRRLRSDHASAATPTEVQLEATLGGRAMRITRRPEQERPKRRGSGTTTEPARILLEELHGTTWRAVSTCAGEADDETSNLMGMSAGQFFPVVLLPQGEFARFLHSNADDREEVLHKPFGTDRFRKVQDWLAERRRATARAVQEARQAVRELAARVAQAAGAPDGPGGRPGYPGRRPRRAPGGRPGHPGGRSGRPARPRPGSAAGRGGPGQPGPGPCPPRGARPGHAPATGRRTPGRASGPPCRRAAHRRPARPGRRDDFARHSQADIAAKLEHADLVNQAAPLRMARIDGMRAELAAALADGAPCPVCGSLDHPEPCDLSGERVTREQEEAADADAAAAAERAETIGARLGAPHVRVADLSARLEGAGFAVATDLPTLAVEARRLVAVGRRLQAEVRRPAAARLPDPQQALDDLGRAIAAGQPVSRRQRAHRDHRRPRRARPARPCEADMLVLGRADHGPDSYRGSGPVIRVCLRAAPCPAVIIGAGSAPGPGGHGPRPAATELIRACSGGGGGARSTRRPASAVA
jgi:exonuclease SbcC